MTDPIDVFSDGRAVTNRIVIARQVDGVESRPLADGTVQYRWPAAKFDHGMYRVYFGNKLAAVTQQLSHAAPPPPDGVAVRVFAECQDAERREPKPETPK